MRAISLVSIILIMGSTSFQALGQWYPSPRVTQSAEIGVQPLRCPTIGKDYSQMISSLHILQDKIKKDANCDALANELKQMGELGNQRRTDFLATIEKVQSGGTLTDAESKKLTSYVEDMTMKAAGLATILTNSAQCFGEQDLSTSLFAVSSFVNEASTLLSTIAGPWGPALSIGGKVVSGLIQGVNRFIQSLPGYDFKDKKDWQGYVETLCMFHEQQDEIQALIHPAAAISELNVLNQKAEMAIRTILNHNPEGNKVVSGFLAQNDAELEAATIAANNVNQSNDGLKVVRLLTAQKWIDQRIKDIRKDANDPLISATGQHLVQKMRDEIEEFLVARQGPKFVTFQNNDAYYLLRDLNSLIVRDGYPIFAQILRFDSSLVKEENMDWTFSDEERILNTLMSVNERLFLNANTSQGEQLYASLAYFKRSLAKQWDAISLSYGVKVNFCDFFQKAGYYDGGIRGSCTSRTAQGIETSIQRYVKLGVSRNLPPYLDKNIPFTGLNWTQSLDVWLSQH